jgi:PBSX family phage terminase large subunit
MNGFRFEKGDAVKDIRFDFEGRTNTKQKQYFETLFGKNWKLKNEYDEFSYFGAFRCGKSFSQQLSVYLICCAYPNTKAVYIRDTYDQLQDSVIKQFNDLFSEWGAYEYYQSAREARFKNGSVLKFRTFEKDTGILSAEYDLIAVCQAEDLPYELFLQLIGRASGKILGEKGIILVEGNPAAGWVKERYKDQLQEVLKAKRIFFLEGKTQDNPHITKAYIQSLLESYPKFWLDRYFYGLWDNRDELVLSEFNENENVCDIVDPKSIHRDYIRRNGFDWGWVNPCANLWGYTDYDGVLTIYDEWYQNKTLPEDVAKATFKHDFEDRDGKRIKVRNILTVADYAMKGLKMPVKEFEDRTVWSELEDNGMKLIPCNKEELSNIVLVNILLKTKKLRIAKNCVNLIKEVKNWKWKRIKLGADKNQFEEPTDKDNHGCDALSYLCAELFGRESKDSAKEKLHNESILRALMKPDFKISSLS